MEKNDQRLRNKRSFDGKQKRGKQKATNKLDEVLKDTGLKTYRKTMSWMGIMNNS